MLNDKDIEKIINSISNEYEPEQIILFGSYATGLANENSDLDLLIIKDSLKSRIERGIELKKLIRKHKWMFPIDILVYTHEELINENYGKNSFVNKVLKEGKVVYERN
jgi:uncharacterized protein